MPVALGIGMPGGKGGRKQNWPSGQPQSACGSQGWALSGHKSSASTASACIRHYCITVCFCTVTQLHSCGLATSWLVHNAAIWLVPIKAFSLDTVAAISLVGRWLLVFHWLAGCCWWFIGWKVVADVSLAGGCLGVIGDFSVVQWLAGGIWSHFIGWNSATSRLVVREQFHWLAKRVFGFYFTWNLCGWVTMNDASIWLAGACRSIQSTFFIGLFILDAHWSQTFLH